MPNTFTDPEAHELAEGIAEHDRLVKGMLDLREKWENETFKEYGLIGVCKELADAINVVQDRVDAVITQHRVLAEKIEKIVDTIDSLIEEQLGAAEAFKLLEEVYIGIAKKYKELEERVVALAQDLREHRQDDLELGLEERVARLEATLESLLAHNFGMTDEPRIMEPDASWRD